MSEERIGIIGGTGLGDALLEQIEDLRTETVTTPFGRPSSAVALGHFAGRPVAFLNRHGVGHRLPPSEVPYAANLYALKKLGVTTLLASGAVGSLREEIEPTQLVVVDQFIDKTSRRRSTFFDKLGAVHVEFDQPCCARLRRVILKAAERTQAMTHEEGTYVCMEGPQFSTRAESLMHRGWGGDLIGMTALPEAKLAREAQMCYALIALVSDYDAWKPHPTGKDRHELLTEIMSNLRRSTHNAVELVSAVLRSDQPLIRDECDCRRSLEMAVWTRPEVIRNASKEKVAILFT